MGMRIERFGKFITHIRRDLLLHRLHTPALFFHFRPLFQRDNWASANKDGDHLINKALIGQLQVRWIHRIITIMGHIS